MKQNIYSLPIFFSINEENNISDGRFLNVTIDVLHTGLNFNSSVFEKDIVNENVETIKNTPILGFIRMTNVNEKDFKGHEYIITRTENGIERKYIGVAYGIVPESCNPRWITKICDDGQEREFLRVDGLLWSKFTDSIEIFKRDIEKPHSMELYPANVEGYEDDDGNFHFTKFSFDGCCILGSEMQPAMINSNIVVNNVNFTMNDFIKDIQSELYNQYTTFTKMLGEQSKNEGGSEEMPNTDFSTVMAMFDDIANIVADYEKIKDYWGDEVPRYYLADIQDNEVIIVDRADYWHYYGATFTLEGDKPVVNFESAKRKKVVFEDYVEGSANAETAFDFGKCISDFESATQTKISEYETKITELETAKTAIETEKNEAVSAKDEAETNYSAVKSELDEIKPKYEEYVAAEQKRADDELNAQKDEMLAQFEKELSDNEDYISLKENKKDYSLEEIEAKCSVMFVRKNKNTNFSKVSKANATIGVPDINAEDTSNKYVSTIYGKIPVSK